MTSRRSIAVSLTGWLVLLPTVLLAAAVAFGVPVVLELESARMKHMQGYAYIVRLPKLSWPLFVAEGSRDKTSVMKLSEDGRPLGPAQVTHASLGSIGQGRYTHWQQRLHFSASDNSDPRTNGRCYRALLRVQVASRVLPIWFLCLGAASAAAFVPWLLQGRIGPPDVLVPASLWVGTGLSFGAAASAVGLGLWLVLGSGAVFLAWAVETTRRTVTRGLARPWRGFEAAQKAMLLAASLAVALAAAELLLMLWERRAVVPKPAAVSSVGPEPDTASIERQLESFGVDVPRKVLRGAARRAALRTLPPELDRAPAEVEGARKAYTWHGVLHVKDSNRMRRTNPFPARREHVFRVMVVGDSLTYGEGIDERWTYARLLEALLEPDYDVEVLNLGVSGHQSEDVLGKVRDFLPRLSPDLVVYGVCPNDFLPSGKGQYQNNYAYALPFSESVKSFFMDNSRLVRLSEDAYNQTLLETGLRADFFDDILSGFAGHQQRFARDIARMNGLVTARGLPPVVALTLDQRPRADSRGYLIAQVAEKYLKNAGIDVIEMASYYRQFEDQNFRVSRWEGHPNEAANSIWAVMLDRHLRRLAVLHPFRKSAGRSDGTPPGDDTVRGS